MGEWIVAKKGDYVGLLGPGRIYPVAFPEASPLLRAFSEVQSGSVSPC